jgi:hypothetical protein
MRTRQQPLKISIVFDHADSASETQVLIRHDVEDISSQTRLLSLEKLIRPETNLKTARHPSNTNILDLIGPVASQAIRPMIGYFTLRGGEGPGKGERLN